MNSIFTQLFKAMSLASLLLASAQASVGPDVKRYDQNEWSSICRLTILDQSGQTGICSATVINASQLLTAEHCFRHADLNQMVVIASCGMLDIDEFVDLKKYRKNNSDTSGFDLAILTTKNPILDIKPISITQYPEMYFLNPNCKVLGFGQDEHQQSNDLRGFDLNGVRLDYQHGRSQVIKASPKVGSTLRNTVTEGDSGGPLICKIHKQAPWEILGVSANYQSVPTTHPGVRSVITNIFAPAFAIH